MSKYQALTEFLEKSGNTEYNLTFGTIEASILKFKLPESAYKHRPWWANTKSGHSQSQAWQSIGWETSNVDLENQRVTFMKIDPQPKLRPIKETNTITIEEAKIRLAAKFGVEPQNIEITVRV